MFIQLSSLDVKEAIRDYILKITSKSVSEKISDIKYLFNDGTSYCYICEDEIQPIKVELDN